VAAIDDRQVDKNDVGVQFLAIASAVVVSDCCSSWKLLNYIQSDVSFCLTDSCNPSFLFLFFSPELGTSSPLSWCGQYRSADLSRRHPRRRCEGALSRTANVLFENYLSQVPLHYALHSQLDPDFYERESQNRDLDRDVDRSFRDEKHFDRVESW